MPILVFTLSIIRLTQQEIFYSIQMALIHKLKNKGQAGHFFSHEWQVLLNYWHLNKEVET